MGTDVPLISARLLLTLGLLTGPSLFSTHDPLRFQLTAPFAELFENARDDDSYTVTGSLTTTIANGQSVTIDDLTIALRGNTSRRESECAFPKLKVTLPPDASASMPEFAGLKSLKIGTHCGEAPNDKLTRRFGRLANQQSPLREGFVYSLLAALGVPALNARPAVITYVESDSASSGPRAVERNALLLEDSDEAIERLGGKGEITEHEFTTAQERFTPADTLAVVFAQAALGNFDWCLKMTADDTYRCDRRHPVWNIAVADLGGGKARPVLQDFDVSGIVTGGHPWFADVFDAAFVPSHSPIEVEVLAQVQRTRTLYSRTELDRARAAFSARKTQAFQALDASRLDPEGRRVARAYLDAFFAAIESDAAFYRPVVVSETKAFLDIARRPVCQAATVPPGTPVSDPIARDGSLVQVRLLDALWRWAPPTQCMGIRGPVWIEADAISREFPVK